MDTFNSLAGQRRLNSFYLRELGNPVSYAQIPAEEDFAEIHRTERAWNAYEEARIANEPMPDTAEEFRTWYNGVHRQHRLDVTPFFDYLADRASPASLALYIGLEENVDGRFDDVIALAQVGMSGDMKLALAENYWDEMGLGRVEDMHTVMFGRSTAYTRAILDARKIDPAECVTTEALKNGNLLMMYALRRRNAPRLLGALTILEHTAPYRFAKTVKGLQRIGAPEEAIAYHDLHVTVDANHGKQLIERVLDPVVKEDPTVLREVCIGCLIRYRVAMDYYRSIQETIQRLRLDDHVAVA